MTVALKRRVADLAFRSADLTFGALRSRDPNLAPPITRHAFLRPVRPPAVEIGPFDRPCLKGEGIYYFDVLDQEGLRRRAQGTPGRDPKACPHVDYVSPNADLGVIDRTFNFILSSHVIEHQPDLMRHLKAVRKILEKDGKYYLMIPDKRFCFDHFLPVTSIEEVLAARGRLQHSEAKVREHLTGTTHNNSVLHWLGIHGRPSGYDASAALAAARRGEYVDVHAWQFTPPSFRSIIDELSPETGLSIDRVHDTMVGAIEFMAVLKST